MHLFSFYEPEPGAHERGLRAFSDFLTGLRTAIDGQPVSGDGDTDYLVLENNFAPVPSFPPTGASVRLFEEPGSSSTVVSGCTLYRPTSISIDPKTGQHYAPNCCGAPSCG